MLGSFSVQGLVQVTASVSTKDGKTYFNCSPQGCPALRFGFRPVDGNPANEIKSAGLYQVEGQIGEQVFSGKASLVLIGTAVKLDEKKLSQALGALVQQASGVPTPAKATA